MRFLLSIILFGIVCVVSADSLPAILFTGSHKGACGHRMAEKLVKKGYNVNSAAYPGLSKPLSWDQAKKYNVIVLAGMGESNADGSLKSSNQQTLATLRKFLEAGGGLLIMGHFGQRDTEISPQEAFLKPLGLSPIWKEIPVDANSIEATFWKIDFSYTNVIKKSPITENVTGLWYPAPSRRIGAQHHSVAFKSDASWNTVITGEQSSSTTHEYNGTRTSGQSATFTKSVPLVAYRTVGKGRIIYLGIGYEYFYGPDADTILEDIVNIKGLDGKTSDGAKLFDNCLAYLAEPSTSGKELGGATTPSALLRDPVKAKFCKPFNWKKQKALPLGRLYDQAGLIGPRTSYSSGTATPTEWVKAAKAEGYSFIAFLEDFKLLTPEKFKQLKAECRKLTDDKFAAMAGFTIDDEVGNHYFYFGSALPLPKDMLYDHNKKVFVSYDSNLNRKNPHAKGQLGMTTLHYFIGKCIGKATGGNFRFNSDSAPFADFFGNWNAMGVVTTDNGKLEEFVFDDYLKLCNSGQAPVPIAINLLSSPKQLQQIKWRTVYKSREDGVKELLKFFNKQKFYPKSPTELFISSGPRITDWGFVGPRDYVFMNPDDFVYQNYRWKVYGSARSKVGLKEINIWNGVKLFRRFDVKGKKKLKFTLDLTHNQQHYLVMEVIDINGGIAVSEGIWDRNHRNEEFMCGDRNNQLSFSQTVNSDGYYINVGGNQALSTPNKRLAERGISPAGAFKNHPMLGSPGFDGGASGDPEFFESGRIVTNTGSIKVPRVSESQRILHCGDVNIGETHREHVFTGNIREANVWHTLWATTPAQDFTYYVRNHYFQLDPDKPLTVFLKQIKITLKRNIANNGITIGTLQPRKASSYLLCSGDGKIRSGDWVNAKDGRIKLNLSGGFGAMLGSPLGSVAIFPLTPGVTGNINTNRKEALSFMLAKAQSPQRAGETATIDMLLLGIPRPTPPLTNKLPRDPKETVEKFYRDFGLAPGSKAAYALQINIGKVMYDKYPLRVDGSADKCFSATVSGELITALPIAVSGMNDNWSAYMYDGSVNKSRPLGVVENTAWATIVVTGQEVFIGHPVVSDHDALHLQVTQVGDDIWSLEIHNPTKETITANISLNNYFVPFKDKKQPGKVTVQPGSSMKITL